MLSAAVVALLACPICGQAFRSQQSGRSSGLICVNRHSFDVARQGYVSLLAAPARFHGDDAAMLDARARVHASGAFDGLLDAVARSVTARPARIIEIGSGTGTYLLRALAAAGVGSLGVGLDASKVAARALARVGDPAIASVVGDAWGRWPILDGALTDVICAFAPRNFAEAARVLLTGGALHVLTPTSAHLRELVEPLGMVHVEDSKLGRLDAGAQGFELAARTTVEYQWLFTRETAGDLAAMGPSAHHGEAARAQALAALPDEVPVTLSAVVSTFIRSEALMPG